MVDINKNIVNFIIKKPLVSELDIELVEKCIQTSDQLNEVCHNVLSASIKDWHIIEDNIIEEKKSCNKISEEVFIDDGSPLILIVDDLIDMKRHIRNVLCSKYTNIICADNGLKGLETARARKPDLIITDWMMPLMTGPDLIKEIKADEELSSTPIILLTAKSDEESRVLGTETGADGFLGKPFNKIELLSLANNLLQLKLREKEIEKAFNELKRSKDELARSEKLGSLGVFSAGLNHEINNPNNFVFMGSNQVLECIDNIKNALQVLEDVDGSEDLVEYLNENINLSKDSLDNILTGSKRISAVIKGLKEISHLHESGKNTFDLNEIIEDAVQSLEFMISNNIKIEMNLECKKEIICDYNAVKQVMLHILRNAIQSINKENSGKIEIYLKEDENNVIVQIKDNGSGISSFDLPKIFDPFFSTRDVGQGMGLGLSISHNIIDSMSGKIIIDSEQVKGTNVKILLPVSICK